MTSWIFLLGAGLLEIGWAISLKMTKGFTYLPALATNVLLGLAAAFCLAQAMRHIPIVTAYPIWKGIAIIGLFVWQIFVDKSALSPLRCAFALLIVAGIVGLKLTEASP